MPPKQSLQCGRDVAEDVARLIKRLASAHRTLGAYLKLSHVSKAWGVNVQGYPGLHIEPEASLSYKTPPSQGVKMQPAEW